MNSFHASSCCNRVSRKAISSSGNILNIAFPRMILVMIMAAADASCSREAKHNFPGGGDAGFCRFCARYLSWLSHNFPFPQNRARGAPCNIVLCLFHSNRSCLLPDAFTFCQQSLPFSPYFLPPPLCLSAFPPLFYTPTQLLSGAGIGLPLDCSRGIGAVARVARYQTFRY